MLENDEGYKEKKIVESKKKKYRGECNQLWVGNKVNHTKNIILNLGFEG